MGTIPALGFKTNVKDEKLVEEITTAISERFGDIENKDDRLIVHNNSDGKILYAVLDGYNEYFGLQNNGLVFAYIPLEWPNWNSYSEYGNLMSDVRDFVDEEFEYVDVDDLMPITPTT